MQCRARERWGERSTEAITSLRWLLVISALRWKSTRTFGREPDGQTGRGKAPVWLRCPESIKRLSRLWQRSSVGLLDASLRADIVTRTVWELFKNPNSGNFWALDSKIKHEDKRIRRMRSLTSCQGLWTLPGGVLCGTWWGSCWIAEQLCNQKSLEALGLF